jgi:hypothetical protein
MDLGRPEAQLICVVIAGGDDAAQDVPQLGFVVDEPQQRFTARAPYTDAENVFRGRVEADDEQVAVEQDDA